MAEAALSVAIEGVLTKLITLLSHEILLVWGLKRDLNRLENSLISLKGFLQYNEPCDLGMKRWLHTIRDVVFSAENVLDEFAYEMLRRKVKVQSKLINKVRNILIKFNSFAYRIILAHKIRKINKTLNEIKSEGAGFGYAYVRLQSGIASSDRQLLRAETHSVLGGSQEVIGRDEEVSRVVNLLGKSSNNGGSLYVVSVIGMAGLGKTTLAKKVFKEIDKTGAFDFKIWICVSNNFDAKRIFREMLECVDGSAQPKSENLDLIIKCLVQILRDKRFLLVLDDVWNEDENIWNNVEESLLLLSENNQNSVLVTTRKVEAAEIMRSNDRCLPARLTVEECWNIIKEITFGRESVPLDLVEIGRQIAKKCCGLPLIARVLGGTMKGQRTKEEWSMIQSNKAWNMGKDSKEVMPILRLSFDRLPYNSLKQCFLYGAIFPKDFKMEKDLLIQQWISQGYFEGNEKEKSLEDIGNEHFSYLVGSCLFQDVERQMDSSITCKMHDALHDLACHISKSEICNFERAGMVDEVGSYDVSNDRLLNIDTEVEMLRKISEGGSQRKLRALFTRGNLSDIESWHLKGLRTLSIWDYNNDMLPVMMEKFKYLTYLDVSRSSIQSFPESFVKLYRLETLICRGCKSLKQLPEAIRNFINLRFLDLSYSKIEHVPASIEYLSKLQYLICKRSSLKQLPDGIGNLVDLRYLDVMDTAIKTLPFSITNLKKLETLEVSYCELEEFPDGAENLMSLKYLWFSDPSLTPARVGKLASLEILPYFAVGREEGQRIEELKWLDKLKGSLSIHGLENVRDKEEAMRAKLKEKPDLHDLELYFGSSDVNNDEEVLEGLRPHKNIQTLKIFGFRGERYPRWISDPEALPQLKELKICSANNCIELPMFSRLPLLELSIGDAPKVRRIEWSTNERNAGTESSSLGRLELHEMNSLAEWVCSDTFEFPSLRELEIEKCPKLKGFSGGFPHLSKLRIWKSGIISLPCCLLECRSLRKLQIAGCDNLTWVPEWIKNLTCLEKLGITYCRNLKEFPGESLRDLSELRELRLGGFCEELREFPFSAPERCRLESLQLIGWRGLKSLPCQIQHLTTLRKLEIRNFGDKELLREWSANLPSLKEIRIFCY